MWIELHGASEEWSSGEREYVERGKICVNMSRADAYYDHTILFHDNNKIRVMETVDEIKQRMTVSQQMEEADGQSV